MEKLKSLIEECIQMDTKQLNLLDTMIETTKKKRQKVYRLRMLYKQLLNRLKKGKTSEAGAIYSEIQRLKKISF